MDLFSSFLSNFLDRISCFSSEVLFGIRDNRVIVFSLGSEAGFLGSFLIECCEKTSMLFAIHTPDVVVVMNYA